MAHTICKFLALPFSDKDRPFFGRIIRLASQSLHEQESQNLIKVVLASVVTDSAHFHEEMKPIPHLTSVTMTTMVSSKVRARVCLFLFVCLLVCGLRVDGHVTFVEPCLRFAWRKCADDCGVLPVTLRLTLSETGDSFWRRCCGQRCHGRWTC